MHYVIRKIGGMFSYRALSKEGRIGLTIDYIYNNITLRYDERESHKVY